MLQMFTVCSNIMIRTFLAHIYVSSTYIYVVPNCCQGNMMPNSQNG